MAAELNRESCLYKYRGELEELEATKNRLERLSTTSLPAANTIGDLSELIAISESSQYLTSSNNSPRSTRNRKNCIVSSDSQVETKYRVLSQQASNADTLSLLETIKHTRQKLKVRAHLSIK